MFKKYLGSKILSELNDLKRTVDTASVEIGLDKELLEKLWNEHQKLIIIMILIELVSVVVARIIRMTRVAVTITAIRIRTVMLKNNRNSSNDNK